VRIAEILTLIIINISIILILFLFSFFFLFHLFLRRARSRGSIQARPRPRFRTRFRPELWCCSRACPRIRLFPGSRSRSRARFWLGSWSRFRTWSRSWPGYGTRCGWSARARCSIASGTITRVCPRIWTENKILTFSTNRARRVARLWIIFNG
jgi:hypothetical protein